jgi:hypothetical protein
VLKIAREHSKLTKKGKRMKRVTAEFVLEQQRQQETKYTCQVATLSIPATPVGAAAAAPALSDDDVAMIAAALSDDDEVDDMMKQLQSKAAVVNKPKYNTTCQLKPAADTDKNCLICMDQLDTKDIRTLRCAHPFHTKCIDKWLKQKIAKGQCPVCQTKA